MTEFLIAVAPLLLLVVALLFGRYPGCETAMRLAERLAARVRPVRPAVNSWIGPRQPASHAASGGLLLAFGLSGRAPPA
jgi:hypothetical protein